MVQPASTLTVKLPAAEARQYDILTGPGLLPHSGALIRERLGVLRCVIVTETTVAPLYLNTVLGSLKQAGHDVLEPIIVPAGEGSKSFAQLEALLGEMYARHVDRKTLVIALGGGVMGDLNGFAASIYMRGTDFMQIPTTLLSQVDSSVGGKTMVNASFGKNMVGVFAQPRLVIQDTATLNTLPMRQILGGYAEIIKYGLIMSRPFFDWCLQNHGSLLDGDIETRTEAVQRSCLFKAEVVEADEKEMGQRALLNLGHTFGHALEGAMGYDPEKLLHGEGVAIGTIMAYRLSVALGHCPKSAADSVESHFKQAGLPTTIPPLPAGTTVEQMMAYMAGDKKAEAGKITLILARDIGDCFVAKGCASEPIAALWRKMWPAG